MSAVKIYVIAGTLSGVYLTVCIWGITTRSEWHSLVKTSYQHTANSTQEGARLIALTCHAHVKFNASKVARHRDAQPFSQ